MAARIQFPVVSVFEQQRIVFRKDNGEWKGSKLAATEGLRKTSTVRYQVPAAEFSSFLGTLNGNKGIEFTLTTTGYYIWGSSETTSIARMLRYSKPIRTKDFFYEVDVEYLYVRAFP